MDDRWFGNEFQIFEATDENDSEVAMVVLRGGTHIDKAEWSGVLAPVNTLWWEIQDRMAAAAEIRAIWK